MRAALLPFPLPPSFCAPIVSALIVCGLSLAGLCQSELSAQGKIPWEKTLAKALERAKTENKIVVACISMKGERVCDLIVSEHYSDSKIVELARKTVNVFCSPHGTAEQRELEKRVRIDLLKKDASAWMVAPQHVFFTPTGKIISSASYAISVGELEWMWAEALRAQDETFKWEYSDRMRAPRQLQAKKTAVSKVAVKPPTKKELDAMMREIKRGYGGYYGAKDKLPVIVRHPGGQARKFVERILKSIETRDSARISILKLIGSSSPRSWHVVIAPYIAHDKPAVRIAAANAMGELGERKGVKPLSSRWRKETEADVKSAILRAMVRCGPNDSRVVKMVPFVLKDYDEVSVRVNAALAAGGLENRKVVTTCLSRALGDKSGRVRATAAFTIASRREVSMLTALKAAAKGEKDADVKGWMEAASKVIAGETMDLFEGFMAEVVKAK